MELQSDEELYELLGMFAFKGKRRRKEREINKQTRNFEAFSRVAKLVDRAPRHWSDTR